MAKRSLWLIIIGDESQTTDHAVVLEISIKISGLKQARVMQLSVKIKEIQVQILIDSKSIHYFMNVAIIAQLQLPIQGAACLSWWQMENLSPELVSVLGYKLCWEGKIPMLIYIIRFNMLTGFDSLLMCIGSSFLVPSDGILRFKGASSDSRVVHSFKRSKCYWSTMQITFNFKMF